MNELASQLQPYSDDKLAFENLNGTYELVYSGSQSGKPSGVIIGPIVGKVTQIFYSDTFAAL